MRTRCLLAVLCASISLLTACGGGSSITSSMLAPAASTSTAPGTSSGATTSSSSTTTPAPSATPGSSLPSAPSTATIFDAIQDTTDSWSSCSDCAGGTVTSAYSTAPFQATPSMSGSSRLFNVSGPAWSDVLWIHKLGAHNSVTHFFWDFYVYFDATSAPSVWSAEYDLWQSIAGQKAMIGSQCVFGTNEWDVWDSANNKWVNTGVPCPRFAGGSWHHIQWHLERVSATQYRYNTLFVDDQPFSINRVFNTEPTDWDDSLGVQWQLDQDGSGTPVSQWVDKVKLTIW